jgi:hypothetical protein
VPTRAAGDTRFRVGELGRAANYNLTIVSLGECKVGRYFRPRPGYVLLGVEMRFEAISDQSIPVNGFYAKLVDASGQTYSATLGGCEPTLPARRIRKPEKVSGVVGFEIPEKAKDFTLSYHPFIVGSMNQELHFRLRR